MSELSVGSNRFWQEFKSDVAGTLSEQQKLEINRVLGLEVIPVSDKLGDLRLSFKWYFLRLIWGPEKRSIDRIKTEQEMHPVMTRKNAPLLASLFAGYAAVTYISLSLFVLLLAYVML